MRNWNLERSVRLAEEQQIRQLAITEATSDLVATTDIDGFLISLNKAGFNLLQINKDIDITQLRLADFYPLEYGTQLSNFEIPDAIKNEVCHSETTLLSSSGEEIPCSQVLISHRDKNDNISFFSVILRDISDLKNAEKKQRLLIEQLHQAKKMETIGRLAGGVAHDFNNILTVIVGYAELSLLNMKPDQPAKNELEIILNSAQKATRLSNQLLDFSSKQMIEPQVLSLNTIIKDSQKIIESLLGGEIQTSTSLDENLWAVKIDRSQLEQAILNMAINARDALSNHGHFMLRTQNISLNEPDALLRGIEIPGDYILFTVSDTGAGIEPDIIEHIFEPFYTTKDQGKGTGLGLSSVYGAIKQNNGYITVKSEINHGTVFDIYLPRIQNDIISEESEHHNHFDDKSLRGHECILLVDDNPDIRSLLCTILSDLGYSILQAKNATTALEVFSDKTNKIDLVISDVAMPHIDGLDLCSMLQAQDPTINVLLVSGHTERIIALQELDKNNVTFLSKPFPSYKLACEVRKILDSRSEKTYE